MGGGGGDKGRGEGGGAERDERVELTRGRDGDEGE